MPEFLSDPNWLDVLIGVVALIVSVAAIVLTIHFYKKSQRRKSLSYEVITSSPLISINREGKEHAGDVTVLYNGEEFKNIRIIIVKIINDGDIDIEKKDMDIPPTFKFSEETEILSYEIIEKQPVELPAILHKNMDTYEITLEKLLINATDSVTIKFLISNYAGAIKPTCRIVGIKKISQYSHRGNKTSLFTETPMIFLVLFISTITLLESLSAIFLSDSFDILPWIISVLMLIMLGMVRRILRN